MAPQAKVQARTPADVPAAPAPAAKAGSGDKPVMDVVAGALARAGSQSTIHPIDTLKVRMQAGKSNLGAIAAASQPGASKLKQCMLEVGSLYKGVFGAASGAGIIIGSYFAFYSNSKKLLREHTDMSEGSIAFVSGAVAAVGSSVVKVPLAVCIRSVQAGVYPNFYAAAKSIVDKAGLQGLFTGFLPTLLEDVPDMAVKFTVYESLRTVHAKLRDDARPTVLEDLLMGGFAGSAAAAATTPLDIVKTRMMCNASERPTILGAARSVLAEGKGWKGFFTGVGPRSLSNGLNSAIFFCFFEAIRRILLQYQQQWEARRALAQERKLWAASPSCSSSSSAGRAGPRPASISLAGGFPHRRPTQASGFQSRAGERRWPCLSLAIPLELCGR